MAGARVGLVYDLLGTHPAGPGAPPDADAEYEPEETVRVLEGALRRLGHAPVRLGSPHALLRAGGGGGLPALDAAVNVAEGYGSRNREAWAPVLLEMLGVPAVGSDALTLSLSLDKAWTHAVLESAEAAAAPPLPAEFPLFVKPRWEGTAKGIGPGSRVESRAALRREVERVARLYGQPALVEAFLEGAEYTVTLVGSAPPRALPVLQRALEAETRIGLHALERHPAPGGGGWRHALPGALEPALEAELARLATAAFEALRCRDFARVDLRLGADGRPRLLEVNPLPTFAREGSFGILAELLDRPLEDLLAEVLGEALARIGIP